MSALTETPLSNIDAKTVGTVYYRPFANVKHWIYSKKTPIGLISSHHKLPNYNNV